MQMLDESLNYGFDMGQRTEREATANTGKPAQPNKGQGKIAPRPSFADALLEWGKMAHEEDDDEAKQDGEVREPFDPSVVLCVVDER